MFQLQTENRQQFVRIHPPRSSLSEGIRRDEIKPDVWMSKHLEQPHWEQMTRGVWFDEPRGVIVRQTVFDALKMFANILCERTVA
jgi:hypothetical protein